MVFPLLIFGICFFEVFHSSSQNNQRSPKIECRETCCVTPHQRSTPKIKPRLQCSTTLELCNVDGVSSNAKSSHFGAMLYVFEDNDAVIKKIIKGRSWTTRHVSRNHRVALDWLFDRIKLDPKIQIKYVDSKHQLAHILTKGNFTRDEWNHLLHLFNISLFSLTSCTRTMAKRMQEQKGDNRIVAKSKPTTMNLSVSVSTSSSTVNSPIASNSAGDTQSILSNRLVKFRET